MIGWTVKASSSSGARGRRIRLRSVTTSVSDSSASHSAALLFRRVPRQRQEDVVERRTPQRDVIDADACLVEPADRLDDRSAARLTPIRTSPSDMAGSSPHIGANARTAASACADILEVHLEPLARRPDP